MKSVEKKRTGKRQIFRTTSLIAQYSELIAQQFDKLTKKKEMNFKLINLPQSQSSLCKRVTYRQTRPNQRQKCQCNYNVSYRGVGAVG